VIKNPEEAYQIFSGKKEQIDTIKEGTIKFQEKHSTESEIDSENIPEPIPSSNTPGSRIIEPR
jgi:hypothetical protein